jgi:glycosyltransferase involved in cell wall biosynthesis
LDGIQSLGLGFERWALPSVVAGTQTRPFKILHVVPATPFGGIQKLVIDLAAEQRRQGVDAAVLAVYDRGPFAALLRERDIPISVIPGDRLSISGVMRFDSVLRSAGANIVHLHSGVLWTNFVGLIRKQIPWLFHAHNYPEEASGLRALAVGEINRKLVDAVVCVSKSVADRYKQKLGTDFPIFTVYNGLSAKTVGLPQEVSDRSGPPRFGIATRFEPNKGIEEFIEVAAKISDRLPGSRFVLAGEGRLFNHAKRLVAQRNLAKQFEFLGFVLDVEMFWRTLDVVVFTSPREPFGLRVIEPMLVGVPVVSYKTGYGSDELLLDGINALTAPFPNADALAEKAVSLILEPGRKSKLVAAARAIAEQSYGIERVASELTAVYGATIRKQCY